jgi:aspartyl-tRNA(Asn)/glutamyl-tRNA(Gln) amidotransferase subunit B
MAMRVGLALECKIAPTSLFARKNYFYPDLPKGYQISQYEYPLAENGRLVIDIAQGERVIRIRRAHLEEDTGKLTHMEKDGESYSLVDLNRAGIPLLEIVTEPDMHSVEEVRAYATRLRALLRALEVNSGDMEKGALRFEANVSIRPAGSQELGTRVEIKNLNSFKAMERAVTYAINRQVEQLEAGETVAQETLGWDDLNEVTFSQRSKEEAHDYRYFPEPDLPPLVVDEAWVKQVQADLPELPRARQQRFMKDFGLNRDEAAALAEDAFTASYYEQTVKAGSTIPPRLAAIWLSGEIFATLNQSGKNLAELAQTLSPQHFGGLLAAVQCGKVNQNTGKAVLQEMIKSGSTADEIIQTQGLEQLSDGGQIAALVAKALDENPGEVEKFKAGKATVENWLFGQIMRAASGKANPQVVKDELKRQLGEM